METYTIPVIRLRGDGQRLCSLHIIKAEAPDRLGAALSLADASPKAIRMIRVLVFLILAVAGNAVQADEARWLLQTSVFMAHYNPKPEHNNHQRLIGLEYTRADEWLVGGASFLNSFSQRSLYVYTGRRFDLGDGPLFAKLTGGVMHGYRGEYDDKIPLNQLGVAPAIVPALGIKGQVLSSELSFLGAAAILVSVGIQF